jgi:hypothetical protein
VIIMASSGLPCSERRKAAQQLVALEQVQRELVSRFGDAAGLEQARAYQEDVSDGISRQPEVFAFAQVPLFGEALEAITLGQREAGGEGILFEEPGLVSGHGGLSARLVGTPTRSGEASARRQGI